MNITDILAEKYKKHVFSESEIQELKSFISLYPYFEIPLYLYLKSLYQSDQLLFEQELEHYAILISDRKNFFYYIFSEEFGDLYQVTGKKELNTSKTDILLDAFFNKKGGGKSTEENAELEYNIFHSSLASTDYFSYLNVSLEELKADKRPTNVRFDSSNQTQRNIIDTFIEKSEQVTSLKIIPQKETSEDVQSIVVPDVFNENILDEDMFFTETLAKIYIKQKKYEKAYKIIKHLSLNYPKKNIYFADQLSFLEKLIINSKSKFKK